jgi:hypothetical protein
MNKSRETGSLGLTRQINVENTEGAIKYGQSRETGNIGLTRQINVREY